MNHSFKGWKDVADELHVFARSDAIELNEGQRASLMALAERLPRNGVIIADEVGMGKTRIAAVVARSVIAAGGRVAILVPPGLGYQWGDELRNAGVEAPPILRSLRQYFWAWGTQGKETPWYRESALVISHAFTNWRLGEKTSPWRWSLLPEIYARWRKQSGNRWPRGYHENESLENELVKKAAGCIVRAIQASPEHHSSRKIVSELAEGTPWPGALTASEYGRNAQLRPWLERAVGLGLGVFDLVIIDEAHKSRGQDSGLNRLLDGVALQSSDARCVAMTATPVELDVTQWTQMLSRIQVDKASGVAATAAIEDYARAVSRVRQCLSNGSARESFKSAAESFRKALTPYLLRRDKREDPVVRKFRQVSNETHHAYRREREIMISVAKMTTGWKQTVCAAEALSFVTNQADSSTIRRLRLTIGNGHGIAALIDQLQNDEKDDRMQPLSEDTFETATLPEVDAAPSNNKRHLRSQWWQQVMVRPFVNDSSALFFHPAILAAVDEIESICQQGEKVLVFGRFTRPLHALVRLLNAREMLRRLDSSHQWPQSKVHDNEEWAAILAAHQQLHRQGELDRTHLDLALDDQYKELEADRRNLRDHLLHLVEEGFNRKPPEKRIRVLFDAFKDIATSVSELHQDNETHAIAVVARAIHELIGVSITNAVPSDFSQAFIELVAAASDHDEGDTDGDGLLGQDEATALWSVLIPRLCDEYNRPEGGYARLMFGGTKPSTRRFLQLAFNRKQGHPRVLVAQSLVGREGLNLHKACRTVVLLHPEWNPGVVEQQIGRVDRIGSLWEQKLNEAVTDSRENNELPRIEIKPVVFQGTYDEKNWQVLRDRWDDLRAQLHGIVISPRLAERYPDSDKTVAEINDAAPNFSPLFGLSSTI